jgi:spermidine/putrescine transport system permease protein
MSTETMTRQASMTAPTDLPPAPRSNALQRAWRWLRSHIIALLGIGALIYMFMPIVVVVLFSFNNPVGRFNYSWNQFSLDAWTDPCKDPLLCSSVTLSLEIGVVATIVATTLGTLIAFALGRHRFRGRATTNVLIFLPMATPEVVMGASLLALFVNLAVDGYLGAWSIAIAHIMFSISFVVTTVKARIAGLDPRLEQAAMDLYADERTTFRKVTFPLVLPGIVAAALLAFSLSFDDFVITQFAAGQTTTFPIFVWGSSLRGIPPEANVVGSAMFIIAFLIVLIPTLAQRRKAS